MKKLVILVVVFISGFWSVLNAQFNQIELFSGLGKTDFTFFSSLPIDSDKSLNLNTLAFIQKFNDSENKSFDEIGVQPTVFYNLSRNFAVGTSIYYNSVSGFSERLSIMYSIKKSQVLFILIPTIAHSSHKSISYAEVFSQFQFNQPINDKLSLWLNGQLLTVWDSFKTHSRSFQQYRVGISINAHQFGVGLDFDKYGPNPFKESSFGIYYRKN